MATKYALAQVVNSMFRLKRDWNSIDDESKAGAFFIINQFMCKKYPMNSHFLNAKGFDMSVATEIWFNHQRATSKTPDWFWQKPSKKKYDKNELSQLDKQLLNSYDAEIEEDLKYYTQMYDGPVTEKVKKTVKKK